MLGCVEARLRLFGLDPPCARRRPEGVGTQGVPIGLRLGLRPASNTGLRPAAVGGEGSMRQVNRLPLEGGSWRSDRRRDASCCARSSKRGGVAKRRQVLLSVRRGRRPSRKTTGTLSVPTAPVSRRGRGGSRPESRRRALMRPVSGGAQLTAETRTHAPSKRRRGRPFQRPPSSTPLLENDQPPKLAISTRTPGPIVELSDTFFT